MGYGEEEGALGKATLRRRGSELHGAGLIDRPRAAVGRCDFERTLLPRNRALREEIVQFACSEIVIDDADVDAPVGYPDLIGLGKV